MNQVNRDLAYVWDMHDAAKQALSFIKGKKFEVYLKDKMLRLALERLLEILGQAAKNVSHDFQSKHKEIPWSKIIALRNILAHEYGEIKNEKVFLVVADHLPALKRQLKRILDQSGMEL